jgi:hypothetical protein
MSSAFWAMPSNYKLKQEACQRKGDANMLLYINRLSVMLFRLIGGFERGHPESSATGQGKFATRVIFIVTFRLNGRLSSNHCPPCRIKNGFTSGRDD